jgi:hypothetical protein
MLTTERYIILSHGSWIVINTALKLLPSTLLFNCLFLHCHLTVCLTCLSCVSVDLCPESMARVVYSIETRLITCEDWNCFQKETRFMMKFETNSYWMLLWQLSSGLQCCSCLATFQGVHIFTVENACRSLLRHVFIRLNGVTSKKIRQNLRYHTIFLCAFLIPKVKPYIRTYSYIHTYIHTYVRTYRNFDGCFAYLWKWFLALKKWLFDRWLETKFSAGCLYLRRLN